MTAYTVGASNAVRAIIAKHPTDAELSLQCLTLCQAFAAVGKSAELLADGTVTAVLSAYEEYIKTQASNLPTADAAVKEGRIVAGVYDPSGPHAEAVAVTESVLRFLAFVSVQVGARYPLCGVCVILHRPSCDGSSIVIVVFKALSTLLCPCRPARSRLLVKAA